ncbi:MAG: RNA 3'-terminal phosphate cyclase [Nitrosopumilus sp.]|nr:RNA 3'-terminal phosphate cyclase [Nitrosopumilus sp.]MDH3384825.1 RNA 3'-terminal phosphate cyclase [Nitrosopumilus sp.]
MEFLEIDGSFGEGGGQVVRTAITLSSILNKPIIIKNIRQNRKNPGLKPQHFTAIKLLKKICNANLDQIKIGDTSLKFIPEEVHTLNLKEDVGTAGSISLIFQVLIPVIAICKKKLKLTIIGGTNVLWSPTIDYTQIVLRDAYARMGINFSIDIIKRGYYRKGGGIVELEISPADKIIPINLDKRKEKNVKIICTFSKLPIEIIHNQVNELKRKIIESDFTVEVQIKKENALDSGASLMISSIDNDSIIGIDSIFDKKTKKFDIDLDKFIRNKLSVDEHLADMLVLPASLADGITKFQVESISKHLETNLFVASKITGCKYGIGKLKDGYEVRIEGISYSGIK